MLDKNTSMLLIKFHNIQYFKIRSIAFYAMRIIIIIFFMPWELELGGCLPFFEIGSIKSP